MEVIAVIVTFNRFSVLLETIKFLRNQTLKPGCIYVIDNCSKDETYNYFSTNSSIGLEYIRLSENIGYAGALAVGMEAAKKKYSPAYYWLLDDDSHPEENVLKELVANITMSDFAILGITGFKFSFTKKKKIISNLITEADFVLIDNALVKSDLVNSIGFPDKEYFMMCEDLDYCMRAKEKSFKVGVCSHLSVNRLHLGSTGASKSIIWRSYYHARNYVFIVRRYKSLKMMIYFVASQTKFIIAALFITRRFSLVYYRICGLIHGIFGKRGITLVPSTLKFQ